MRDRLNIELEQQGRKRKEQINTHILQAQKELTDRLNHSEEGVLKELEARRNLAQLERKIKAARQLEEEAAKLSEEKLSYHSLVQRENRLAELMSDLKRNSEKETLKEDALLRELETKRQSLVILIGESQIQEETLMATIDNLQREL